ncbi:Uncharacterized protein PBTT_00877 [Plasmodiophora brassicae]|uniref:Uncharacterized protein n=1 Tax=Plasmodiophora brassicae TaxID=37360 RepID=A0A3P3XYG8_PLABS|nr:unnamed protein product [Plasmodiophora brassicae]
MGKEGDSDVERCSICYGVAYLNRRMAMEGVPARCFGVRSASVMTEFDFEAMAKEVEKAKGKPISSVVAIGQSTIREAVEPDASGITRDNIPFGASMVVVRHDGPSEKFFDWGTDWSEADAKDDTDPR